MPSARSCLTGSLDLRAQGCDQLRDSGLISISKVLFSLEWLHVGGCTMITDVGIRALADLPNLKTLNTPGCILVRPVPPTALL